MLKNCNKAQTFNKAPLQAFWSPGFCCFCCCRFASVVWFRSRTSHLRALVESEVAATAPRPPSEGGSLDLLARRELRLRSSPQAQNSADLGFGKQVLLRVLGFRGYWMLSYMPL